ncbi:hypothetical protein B9Z55_013405 [Caenorhabditis nigoni]|uniref:Uncharacterized protein n=1 Tax=Caenorhabditis nigoni TaxID=1611254 RepID=A0A2G5U1M0_9PELO|nr:hypothetical protein B9Z55_013405 [Caenorhabditis nigoni]
MRKSYIKPPAISTRHRDFPPRPPVRSVHFRSYGCQVKPKDIPNLYKFGISETESQYTGVHYRGDYALLREQIPIPQILPHEELAPIERSASWTSSRRFDSVEMKVAEALADKEGCAAKRKLAIEQEAERKRLKLMGKQNMEKGIAVVGIFCFFLNFSFLVLFENFREQLFTVYC